MVDIEVGIKPAILVRLSRALEEFDFGYLKVPPKIDWRRLYCQWANNRSVEKGVENCPDRWTSWIAMECEIASWHHVRIFRRSYSLLSSKTELPDGSLTAHR